MDIVTRVMLRNDDMPTAQAWQAAIRDQGFDLSLPGDFDPANHAGELRCRIEGAEAAFDYAVRPLDRRGYNEVELRDLGTRNLIVLFTVRHSLESMGAATIAASMLSTVADGLLSEGHGDFIPAKAAIGHARKSAGMMHSMQQVAGFVQKKGPPPDGKRKFDVWMKDMQSATGITLPLIPMQAPPAQKAAVQPPPPKVRVASPPGSLAALWYEIEDLNRARGVDVDEKFGRPADEEELRYFERRIGHFIPDDLRELLSICSGFEDPWPCTRSEAIFVDLVFVLGGIEFDTLRPAADDDLAVIRGRDLLTLESVGAFPVPKREGPCLCYDCTPATAGRIVEVDMAQGSYCVVAPSLRAWLEQGLAKLKAEQA